MSEYAEQPLSVLHVCQPNEGGAAAVCGQLASRGKEAGQNVRVIAPRTGELANYLKRHEIPHRAMTLRRTPGPMDVWHALQLRREVQSADVVHLHSSKSGTIGRLAILTLPRRYRPKVVFTPHGWSWYVGGSMERLYVWIERRLARKTDTFVTVSSKEKQDGHNTLGSGVPIRTIENGVDIELFKRDQAASGQTAKAGPTVVLVVGRLAEVKGQDRAIEAFRFIASEDFVLHLVGAGPQEANLRALVERLNLHAVVKFIGNAPAREHLQSADIVLMPSRYEGMSLLMLEAMSMECCVLALEVGGTDVLEGAGVVLPQEATPEALAEEIVRLAADSVLRRSLGIEARRRVVEGYSIQRFAARHFELYAELRMGGCS